MYATTMTSLVASLMQDKKVTQAYVSAYLNADRKWLWYIYEAGQVIETLVNSSQWASGNPTGAYTTYRYAAYSTQDRGLISSTGYDNYPVICNYEDRISYSPPEKKFPWWAILILVLSVAAVIMIFIVYCCCCKKKQYDDADEDSELATRSGSFRSRGSSHAGSSKSDGSSSFASSRRSSFSESESQCDGSSFASSSRRTSYSDSTRS